MSALVFFSTRLPRHKYQLMMPHTGELYPFRNINFNRMYYTLRSLYDNGLARIDNDVITASIRPANNKKY